MSRGWESKSVESQQADQPHASVTPIKPVSSERLGNVHADAERKRQLQALQLQRERILSERTASAHRRSALAAALVDIEERLAELGWSLHL